MGQPVGNSKEQIENQAEAEIRKSGKRVRRFLLPLGAIVCVGVAAAVAFAGDETAAWVNPTLALDAAQSAASQAGAPSQNPSVAQSPAPAASSHPSSPVSPAPDMSNITVTTGTVLTVRMIDSIDSKVNRAGDVFHASLDEPLLINNSTVVPRGTDVYVRLVQSTTEGQPNAKNAMHLQLVKMDFEGRSYALVSSTYTAAGKMKAGHPGRNIGGGAILGTIIGAAVGGGRGAAVGAVVGAAGGGVYADTHKTQQVKVPAETKLDFTLEQPVTIAVMGRPNLGNAPAANAPANQPANVAPTNPPANTAPAVPPATAAPENPPADEQNNSPSNPPANPPSDQQQNPDNSAPAPTDSNPT